MNLEELMDIEVTIASRTPQKLSDVPGAVYVLTGDEIRRSGHTSVQEALRMVPGFYVSHWTNNVWDVTSRGFGTGTAFSNLQFLNQLLVIIDGVVVYTPLYAGTWWPLQDIDLNDVDRVEIIRGPGGILWGSNAVHGIVHIITKSASDTQGSHIYSRGSNDEWQAGARYGGEFGETGRYRTFYRHFNADGPHREFGGFDQDWYISSTGFRLDWGAEGEAQKQVWARAYDARFHEIGFDLVSFTSVPTVDDKQGFQLYGSTTDADGNGTLAGWINYDKQDRKTEVDIEIVSLDLEYKRSFELSDNNTVTAGLGYRNIRSNLKGEDDFFEDYSPRNEVQSIYRVFAVNTWMIPDSDFSFVLGLQGEHSTFSRWEAQPTARLSWNPGNGWSSWASYTQSKRTPSLEEKTLSQNSAIVGNPNFKPEDAKAYELGVRTQLSDKAILDLATFFNVYDDLSAGTVNGFGQLILDNKGEGESYGVELAGDFKPSDDWNIRSGYTMFGGTYTDQNDGSSLGTEQYHPRHQLNIRSYYDVCEEVEFDVAAYFVEDFGDAFKVAERWRLDVRIGYQPCDDLELYVGSQQLNSATESEFDGFDSRRRQFYFGMSWTPGASDAE